MVDIRRKVPCMRSMGWSITRRCEWHTEENMLDEEEVGREGREQLQRETLGQTQVHSQHCQVDTSDMRTQLVPTRDHRPLAHKDKRSRVLGSP